MIDISKLIKAEYEYIRLNANFTERELQLYELRNKQYTYENVRRVDEYECVDNKTDSTSGRPKDKPGDTIMTLW